MGADGWDRPGATRFDRPAAPLAGETHSTRVTFGGAPPGQSGAHTAGKRRASRTRARILIGLAVVVGVAIGIAAVVLAVTWVSADDDAVAEPGFWERGYTEFADPTGEFSLALPSGFEPVSTRGDRVGIGAQSFPNDTERASALDQLTAELPGSVVFVAPTYHVYEGEFTASITLDRVEAEGDADDPDVVNGDLGLAPQATGMVGDPLVVELAAGSALRVEYEDARDESELVRWYLPDGDVTWVLTFRAADLAEYGGHVDVVADTFQLLEPSAVPRASDSASATDADVLVSTPAPDGSFAAPVPEGWVHEFVGTASSPAVHEQLFPDDAASSDRLREFLAPLSSPETRMIAVDPTGWTVFPHRVVVVDELAGADPASALDELVDQVQAEWAADGGLGSDEGRLAGAAGEIGWMWVGLAAGEHSGMRYVVAGPTSVWVVTVWSDDGGDDRPLSDAIATGFSPG